MAVNQIKKDIWRGSQLTLGATLSRSSALRIFRVDAAPGDFAPPITDAEDAYKKAAIDVVVSSLAPAHPQIAMPIISVTAERVAPKTALVYVRYGALSGGGGFTVAGPLAYMRSGFEPQLVFRSTFDTPNDQHPVYEQFTGLPAGDIQGVPIDPGQQKGPPDEKPDPQTWGRPVTKIVVRMRLVADPSETINALAYTLNDEASPSLGGEGVSPEVIVPGFANAPVGTIRFDGADVTVVAIDPGGVLRFYDVAWHFTRATSGVWAAQYYYWDEAAGPPLWKTKSYLQWPQVWDGSEFPTLPYGG